MSRADTVVAAIGEERCSQGAGAILNWGIVGSSGPFESAGAPGCLWGAIQQSGELLNLM
jgi:hypothetical protein